MTIGVGIFRAGTPQIIGIGVSLRLSEIHNAEATITNQAIEDGSIVTDHIISQPDKLEITAEISNADGGENSKTAWLAFKEQIKSRQLFDVLTTHELYNNMAIETISGDHSAPFKGMLQMKISFKKVNRAQLSIVQIPESQLATGIAKAGSSQVDGGRVDPIRQEDDRSLALQLTNSFGGL